MEVARNISWYYSINGRKNGPVTDDGIRQLRRDGFIPSTVMLWQQGLDDWVTFDRFTELTAGTEMEDIAEYARTAGYHLPGSADSGGEVNDVWGADIETEGTATCSICRNTFPLEDFLDLKSRICFRCATDEEQEDEEEEQQPARKDAGARKAGIGQVRPRITSQAASDEFFHRDAWRKKTDKLERAVIESISEQASLGTTRSEAYAGPVANGHSVSEAGSRTSEKPGLTVRDRDQPGTVQVTVGKIVDLGLPAVLAVLLGLFLNKVLALPVLNTLLVCWLCFCVFALSFSWIGVILAGETFGRRLMGLETIELQIDEPPVKGKLFARTALEHIGLLPLGLGYLPAFNRPDGRHLADLMLGTRVIRRRPPEEEHS